MVTKQVCAESGAADMLQEDFSLEKEVVDLLTASHMTVSVVESCTGGMLSARLVNVAGISEVYRQGFITYANEAKTELVGVKEETLKNYGAVSAECAGEMAEGAAKRTGADVTVSVTGIAGPGGGTQQKPVGLVYIACCVRQKTTIKHCLFSGSRLQVREASVEAALMLMRSCILEYKEASENM
ncbi:MAG: nicotinamide-nucleotide amidohydrolase family protein [Lachnospiraceae bacterium]|nr:nicotinamide-nucleotide amidohydrolase family protein [Lachnospiraceae bacterium]